MFRHVVPTPNSLSACIAWHVMARRYITLHCIALRRVALRYGRLWVTLHKLHYTALHGMTWDYGALQYNAPRACMHTCKHTVSASHYTCRQTKQVVPLKGHSLAERLKKARAPDVAQALGMSMSISATGPKHGSNLEARAPAGTRAQVCATGRPGWRRLTGLSFVGSDWNVLHFCFCLGSTCALRLGLWWLSRRRLAKLSCDSACCVLFCVQLRQMCMTACTQCSKTKLRTGP